MRYYNVLLVLLFFSCAVIDKNSVPSKQLMIDIEDNEFWWGGLSRDGKFMPYTANSDIERTLYGNNSGNQAQPLLISSKGRYIWSEQPFSYQFKKGKLKIYQCYGKINEGRSGRSLKESFDHVATEFFRPNGEIPEPLLFTEPQYNTWIELLYDQNQLDILKYAQSIIDNGFPPGVLMIDDNWQEDYGTWKFSARRFKDPKAMVNALHAMGFKVMLWVCPFISADSEVYRDLKKKKLLLLEPNDEKDVLWAESNAKPLIVRWWNGASGLLDLSNPLAKEWLKTELDLLVNEFGVDGFKFDAGDANYYAPVDSYVSYKTGTAPNDHTLFFEELGLNYPMNEFRASWKMAGKPLGMRLRDQPHSWEAVQNLVPAAIAVGLMGYAFVCPDMIGGGLGGEFHNMQNPDQELVVRYAQVSALMPMMQFSASPWRILNQENTQYCREAAILHHNMGAEILNIARESAKTGQPVMKPMCWNWTNTEYFSIRDQFMLGDSILVAPVVEKGKYSRQVIIPEGKWEGDDGTIVEGPAKIEILVPLSRLPWYRKKSE